MVGEVSIYGIYVPWLLPLALLSLVVTRVVGRALARLGFYRVVWHPALFDFAMFIIILGALNLFFSHWL